MLPGNAEWEAGETKYAERTGYIIHHDNFHGGKAAKTAGQANLRRHFAEILQQQNLG
ncbi:MAG: hypothetical protein IT214_10365 [Chitinophagaceae bacterium]|jgi:hypothetical protein|nr:hypothetical protein [Chitinophagaceae bacterium]